jgi:hypothetical protein
MGLITESLYEAARRLVLPLPGGPATATIRGRHNSAPKVSVCVLSHVFGEVGYQQGLPMLIKTKISHQGFRFPNDLGYSSWALGGALNDVQHLAQFLA